MARALGAAAGVFTRVDLYASTDGPVFGEFQCLFDLRDWNRACDDAIRAADYTVRPTRGADNLFLISRASFSAHSPYAHLDGHHQESMHAKVTVLKRSPQTFLAGMHAQLRPIGGRSEPDFSLIQRQGMRISAVTRACTRPR